MKSPMLKMNITADEIYQSTYRKSADRISSQIQWLFYKLGLIANDLVMMIIAFRLAYFIRFDLDISFFRIDVSPSLLYYSNLIILLLPLWLIIFASVGLYNQQNLLGGTEEYSLVFRATLIGLLVVIIISFLEPTFIVARGWLLMAWFFSFMFTSIGRF